jgi:hypothetical protein
VIYLLYFPIRRNHSTKEENSRPIPCLRTKHSLRIYKCTTKNASGSRLRYSRNVSI